MALRTSFRLYFTPGEEQNIAYVPNLIDRRNRKKTEKAIRKQVETVSPETASEGATREPETEVQEPGQTTRNPRLEIDIFR